MRRIATLCRTTARIIGLASFVLESRVMRLRLMIGVGLGSVVGCVGAGSPVDGGTQGSTTVSGPGDTAETADSVDGTGVGDPGVDSTGTDSTGLDETGSTTSGAGECEPPSRVEPGVVLTASGAVRGVAQRGITTFWGIPYAAPPVGALRWQPPQPTACWPGVRSAEEPAAACAQLVEPGGPVIGDEDCLVLNVWTPGPGDDAARPVMVFIHGGGHTLGSGADPLFDGGNLARDHDVVMVTINYRLGALGYLAHEVLDADDPRGVSGNYGLLDQAHALEWVADNIAAFGGDPQRVTVFGESAGAVSTCALLGVPAVQGLVAGAIVQSGGCSARPSQTYRATVSEPWVEASPCTERADVAACLRALPFAQVVTGEPTGFPSVSGLGQTWSAHVDGVTLPASPVDQMEAGMHVDVPLVVGANAEETALDVLPLTLPEYDALVAATFGALAPLVQQAYPAQDYPSPTQAWIALTTDIKFVCGARRSARAAAQGGRSSVFRYHLSYDGYTTGPMGDPAAFHGLELFYVFGNFDALSIAGFPYVPNADDQVLAQQLGEMWTTFARTGDPSTAALAWPAYVPAEDPYAGLDVPPGVGQGVRTAQCDFWDALLGG